MTLWSWGANSYGQLAQGHCTDQLVPVKVSQIPSNIPVNYITGGGGHTLAISEEGSLWTCGANNKGQLGIGHTENVHKLTLVTDLKAKVVMVAGGWDFTLAVTDNGELYTWGSNTFSQLANEVPNSCAVPMPVCIEGKVIQVAAGLRHAVALTDAGSVYCWGCTTKGQCTMVLAEKPQRKVSVPVKVQIPVSVGKVLSIVAGSYHTAIVTDQGCVLVWGCNKYGQSTQDPGIVLQVNEPYLISTKMFEGQRVKVIRSGWTHLIAQTETGALYSWGRADYGQLGRSRSQGQLYSYIPTQIESCGQQIVDFVCGAEHNLFISDIGQLYAVGWNEHGLCGTGDEVNTEQLTNVPALNSFKTIKIGCGGGHCFALTRMKDLNKV